MELVQGRIKKFAVLDCDAFEPTEYKLIFAIVSLVEGWIFFLHFFIPAL